MASASTDVVHAAVTVRSPNIYIGGKSPCMMAGQTVGQQTRQLKKMLSLKVL
jgi:hypothetical protein